MESFLNLVRFNSQHLTTRHSAGSILLFGLLIGCTLLYDRENSPIIDLLWIHVDAPYPPTHDLLLLLHHMLPYLYLMFIIDQYTERNVEANSLYTTIRITRRSMWISSHLVTIALLNLVYLILYLVLAVGVMAMTTSNDGLNRETLQTVLKIGVLQLFGSIGMSCLQLALNVLIRRIGLAYIIVAAVYGMSLIFHNEVLWIGGHISPQKYISANDRSPFIIILFILIQVMLICLSYGLTLHRLKKS
ncbi:hypothetical protein [Paenibacillus sp. YYML68]|uniref:hypothetical protein n=1 Tax=Paenibacillus sp. YYML68 TaxID=2909250 RepID=UPI00248F6C6E|nr:hypothetical protein [Paenibacillus sp. YYML68]